MGSNLDGNVDIKKYKYGKLNQAVQNNAYGQKLSKDLVTKWPQKPIKNNLFDLVDESQGHNDFILICDTLIS